MNVPQQLSVAEALYLLKPEIDSDHLLGYTFVELICLDVIKVVSTMARVHPKDPAPSRMRHIVREPNFDRFTPEPHQEVFLQFLRKKPHIPLHWMSRTIRKKLGPHDFKERLVKAELAQKGLLKRDKATFNVSFG
jgi:hypothetical protein